MNKTRIGLLVAAALCSVPVSAAAQELEEAPEAAEGAEGVEGAEGAEGTEAGEGVEAEGDVGEGELPGEELPDDVPGGGGLEEICKLDPAACPKLDLKKEALRPLPEETPGVLYAVQQIYALRRHRFEFNPYWGVTLNDQFVDHGAPGLAINWYITNVLAVGVNGNYYQPFNVDRDFNADVRRAARIGVPLTEYQWSAAVNATYVAAYGKFSGFGDFIFHYDAYIVGGIGMISTRPIPIIDPNNRNFDWDAKVAFNAGFGFRIYFNRWLAATLEIRDYVFNDKLESLEVPQTIEEAQDESNWFGESKITNNVQFQAGLSIFLPFSFEYRLPK